MNRHKSSDISRVAIFFAIMLVIHFISSLVFNLWPVPIKPTLVHIPVIVASIMYGPRIGTILGGLMGVISVVTNTVVLLPTSYLFSPFVDQGNLASLMIAMVPRLLIGITPYYCYKFIHNKFGLVLSGLVGSLTNTVFVLSGIFVFFSTVFGGNIKALLATIVSTNAIVEMIISALVAFTLIPTLSKLNRKLS
ncbi:ECF transporter S component [Streptococcus dysgalactiae subsp. equisimilis]|uniref:ECF transporter S component n=2 Tax=Streptococcus dysgalactiae TaxID=1334 RepID=A0A9X8XHI8_STREQ|nr:ECF transporter S component [Streptococcus dysgalactiae]ADX24638.1 membrane protein [Streptococcus dysgalactiae subsp. equisimilis ATCC 12394]EGL48313.1 thiamine transporter protein (Thia_YuaJ) [Streptococcus dysgalactiae subsp. equisimilis SK1249]BAN93538.1 integral membrane protein [Streptococcus dysgalactiae subsp. equisimilis 167]KKC16845.1 pantothenic acid transporter pant [Streptococcus dysgalactiae subsp. equisimilis]KKC20870.1 pantothenic acid transporter pant [Streptococcus dysgala